MNTSVFVCADVAKRGMQERLAVSEDRLMRLTRSDTVTSLVQTKLRLAQTDYANLELQARAPSPVCPYRPHPPSATSFSARQMPLLIGNAS